MAAQAYTVVDAQTAKVVASFDDRDTATKYADRRDAAYGAVRYRVERNYGVMSADEFASFMARAREDRRAAA